MSLVLALRMGDGHWLIAGDSICVAGDLVVDAIPKVRRLPDGTVIGHVGSCYLDYAYVHGLPKDADLFDPKFQRQYCVALQEREKQSNERLPEKLKAGLDALGYILARGERCITVGDDGLCWPEQHWAVNGAGRELAIYLLRNGWTTEMTYGDATKLASKIIEAVASINRNVMPPAIWEVS